MLVGYVKRDENDISIAHWFVRDPYDYRMPWLWWTWDSLISDFTEEHCFATEEEMHYMLKYSRPDLHLEPVTFEEVKLIQDMRGL